MKLRNFCLSSCLGLGLTLSSLPSQVEGIFASIKSTGMAATSMAYPLDSFAVAFNPAGLTQVGNRLDLEGGWLHDRGHATISGNVAPVPPPPFPQVNGNFDLMRTHDYYVGNFGFATQWCFPCSDCFDLNLAFGVALYNRDFQKVTQNKIQPLFGTSHPGMEYIHEELATTLALSFYEGHSLGISLDWHIARIKVNGIENFDTEISSSHPGHVTNKGYNYSNGIGFTVGYLGKFCDWLSIGASYRPKTTMERYKKYDGFLAGHGRVDIPEKIAGGISISYIPCWTFCFDVEYLHWKKIKSLSNKLLPGILLSQALGTNEGSGFGFKNQIFYRVGVEYRLDECWALRAGYRHVNSAFSGSQAATNSLLDDVVKDFVTVGFSWNFSECGEFSAFYAHGFKHKVKGENAIPIYPFGGGNVNLTESKNLLAVALGWTW